MAMEYIPIIKERLKKVYGHKARIPLGYDEPTPIYL
jgi:hypothetical protein